MVNSGFSGADVAQLRILSNRLKSQAGKLREVATSSSTALLVAEWTGNDIDAIRDNWKRKSLPMLLGLTDALHEMSVELERHAVEQERASGAPVSSASGSPFDWITRWLEGFVGISILPFLPLLPAPGKAGPKSTQPASAAPSKPAPAPANKPSAKFDQKAEQAAYNSRGKGYGDLGPGQANDGQCTSWVYFRRKQLGLDCPAQGHGFDGGQWAEHMTKKLAEPQAGAVGSYGSHTLIVESVSPGPPKSMTISEMNAGRQIKGQPAWITENLGKVTSDTWTWDESKGAWHSSRFGFDKQIEFGT